ncbi:MAG: peptidase C13, partial [Rhodanobacter sp.]|nr:peptidase C13 [Rhodanobacter sp.]
MRHTLTIVLAFAAGALLMLMLPRHAMLATLAANAGAASAAPATNGTAPAPLDSPATLGDDWPENGPSPEQVLYMQPGLVRQTLARL